MANSLENIGSMIRNERLRIGLTQEELGERVGVGKAQISKIESGKGLTIKTVTKVLDALGMSAFEEKKNEQTQGDARKQVHLQFGFMSPEKSQRDTLGLFQFQSLMKI